MTAHRILIAITIIMSFMTFALFGMDKWKAQHQRWRIPESTLLMASFLMGGIGGVLGMFLFRHKTRKLKFRILVPVFAVIQAAILAFILWTSVYYRAGEAALAAMHSDSSVSVKETKTGWMFDGPSEDEALIFYPGAKVEETAYAPLLRGLAEAKMDVFLIKMPFHLAFFGINAADKVIGSTGYDRYYIGGHSLGGAMAAVYAAGHEDSMDGLILLAAYPTKQTGLDTILIYGSEDKVLNMSRVEDAEGLVSGSYKKYCIDGGNHAQFGDYGKQAGDGIAGISAGEQWRLTMEETIRFLED